MLQPQANNRKTTLPWLLFVLMAFLHIPAVAQEHRYPSSDSLLPLNSFVVRKYPTNYYPVTLKHSQETLTTKVIRGTVYTAIYNVVIGVGLSLSSEQVTKWHKKDKFSVSSILSQYEHTITAGPVIDNDLFIVDYVGHPYQGSVYYNSLRCQGATEWQSALFCAAHSALWEYGWEGGIEQPSIQDLIITPLGGVLIGELTHVLTLKMSRNGFRWYEKVIVCVLNPAYAVNNGFKSRRTRINPTL